MDWWRGVAVFAGLLGMCAPVGMAQARRVHMDRATGVSFAYPAGWLLNGDDDAATAKLRITSEAQPGAVVQLEGSFADDGPYKGTDFEAGAFAYVVVPKETEAACFDVLDASADEGQRPVAMAWHGLPAKRLDARFTVAGTDDTHRMVAVYRRGRCFLLETVIVSSAGGTRPLSAARWGAIRGAFAAVMGSVRIGEGASVQPSR